MLLGRTDRTCDAAFAILHCSCDTHSSCERVRHRNTTGSQFIERTKGLWDSDLQEGASQPYVVE